jgi:hypothetical protein
MEDWDRRSAKATFRENPPASLERERQLYTLSLRLTPALFLCTTNIGALRKLYNDFAVQSIIRILMLPIRSSEIFSPLSCGDMDFQGRDKI